MGTQDKTLRALEDKGLIVRHDVKVPFLAGIPMTVREYEMPISEHILWCDWADRAAPEI